MKFAIRQVLKHGLLMRSFVSILLFTLFWQQGAFAQKGNSVSQEGIDFMNAVLKERRPSVLLASEIPSWVENKFAEALTTDTITKLTSVDGSRRSDTLILNAGERDRIMNLIKQWQSFRWTEEIVDSIHFTSLRLGRSDSLVRHLSWGGPALYRIAPPVFFNEGSCCLFYYDYACGELCGFGELAIYRKTGGKWKRWKTVYQFIS